MPSNGLRVEGRFARTFPQELLVNTQMKSESKSTSNKKKIGKWIEAMEAAMNEMKERRQKIIKMITKKMLRKL